MHYLDSSRLNRRGLFEKGVRHQGLSLSPKVADLAPSLASIIAFVQCVMVINREVVASGYVGDAERPAVLAGAELGASRVRE